MTTNKCEPGRHIRNTKGFSWLQLGDGSFKHFMIRDCRICKDRISEPIYWVNTDTPVCSACLCQDFTVLATAEETITKCNRCGNTDMITLQPICDLEDESDFDGTESLDDEEAGDDE